VIDLVVAVDAAIEVDALYVILLVDGEDYGRSTAIYSKILHIIAGIDHLF
jgi:hypothetical protein